MSARLGWVFAIWRDQISRSFPHGRTRKFTFQSLFYAFTSVECCSQSSFFGGKKKTRQDKGGGREGALINRKRRRDCRQKPLGINPFSVIKGLFHPAPLFSSLRLLLFRAMGKYLMHQKDDVYAGQNIYALLFSLYIYTLSSKYTQTTWKKTGPAGHST